MFLQILEKKIEGILGDSVS